MMNSAKGSSFAFLLGGILIAGCEKHAPAPEGAPVNAEVRCFEAAAWKSVYPQTIVARNSHDNGGTILLRLLTYEESLDFVRNIRLSAEAESRPIYIFEFSTGVAKTGTIKEWNDAGGDINSTDNSVPIDPFNLNSRTDTLTFGGLVKPAAGKTALHLTASPDRELVAVLSAEGGRGFAFSDMLLGKGKPKGMMLHQLFRRKDGSAVGQPVVIPNHAESEPRGPLWSPDGKFVIYYQPFGNSTCIVPIDQPEEKENAP